MKKVRVRFAPSNTGWLHIGGLRTAIFNYLFAKRHNGDFLLRIEDTDQKRYVEKSEEYIKSSLDWLGITPDESPWTDTNMPYRQSERAKIGVYDDYINKMIESGDAYYAFDTSEELEEIREKFKKMKKNFSYNYISRVNMKNSLTLPKDKTEELLANGTPYVIRFKGEKSGDIVFDDMIRGKIKIAKSQVDDKVLMKADGVPTYHFANVVDDHLMKISHVIRGEEWIASTPLHVMLYEKLGFEKPEFAHLPLILNPHPHKGKLSKRTGIKAGFSVFPLTCTVTDKDGEKVEMNGYKDKYEPGAFMNYLSLLGWTPTDDREILTIKEMIEDFDIKRISKGGCRFDLAKAIWVNSKWVNRLEKSDIFSKDEMNKYSDEILDEMISLIKERSMFREDFDIVKNIFFKDIDKYNDDSLFNDEFNLVFKEFIKNINSLDFDLKNKQTIKDFIYNLTKKHNIRFGKIMPGLRQALTGGVSGPDLMTTMVILGKNVTTNRIKKALEYSKVLK